MAAAGREPQPAPVPGAAVREPLRVPLAVAARANSVISTTTAIIVTIMAVSTLFFITRLTIVVIVISISLSLVIMSPIITLVPLLLVVGLGGLWVERCIVAMGSGSMVPHRSVNHSEAQACLP